MRAILTAVVTLWAYPHTAPQQPRESVSCQSDIVSSTTVATFCGHRQSDNEPNPRSSSITSTRSSLTTSIVNWRVTNTRWTDPALPVVGDWNLALAKLPRQRRIRAALGRPRTAEEYDDESGSASFRTVRRDDKIMITHLAVRELAWANRIRDELFWLDHAACAALAGSDTRRLTRVAPDGLARPSGRW